MENEQDCVTCIKNLLFSNAQMYCGTAKMQKHYITECYEQMLKHHAHNVVDVMLKCRNGFLYAQNLIQFGYHSYTHAHDNSWTTDNF